MSKKWGFFSIFPVAAASTAIFFSDLAWAEPIYHNTYTASADVSGSGIGVPKQIAALTDGSIYILGSSLTKIGKFSADGSSFSTLNYDVAYSGIPQVFAANAAGTAVYVFQLNTLKEYMVTGSVLNTITSVTPVNTGTQSLDLGPDGRVYAGRGTTLSIYNSSLAVDAGTPYTLTSASARMAGDTSGNLYYFNSGSKRIRKVVFSASAIASDTILSTLSVNDHKGLIASANGIVYYADGGGSVSKIASSGATLWTYAPASGSSSLIGLSAMTLDASGNIVVLLSSGAAKVYTPINSVAAFSATANGNSAVLTWTTGVSDSDFSGVTIRRGVSAFPASPTDGTAVAVDITSATTYTDDGLDSSTPYYYSIFNKTTDGFYSEATHASVTTDPAGAISVSASTANGIYKAGDAIDITVDFDSPVTVTGMPQLVLATGTGDAIANYVSGSGTATLTFNYIVQVGDTSDDLDYASTAALGLNGGTINDGTGAAASLTLPNPGETGSLSVNKNIVLDTTAPSAPSGLSASASTTNVFLSWTNPASDFASVVIRRSTSGYPTYSSGTLVYASNGTSYTNAGLPDGVYFYSIFALDAVGNVSVSATASVTVDTVAPTLASVSPVTASGTYHAGQTIVLAVHFSESVNVATVGGTPSIGITVGTTSRNALFQSGSGSNTLQFSYTIQNTDRDADGVVLTSPISLNGALIADSSGNTAALTFTPPDLSGIQVANLDLSATVNDHTAGSHIILGGSDASYTITIANSANTDAMNAVVQANWSGNILSPLWACVATGAATCTASGSGDINDTVSIPSGGHVTYTVSVPIDAAESPVTASATVTAGSGQFDINPDNNTTTVQDDVGVFGNGFE